MMTAEQTTDPRIYVGTYAKYSAGSIAGKWLDLEDYGSAEDFLEACRELHADESDPELMFQDFEGFPRAMYGESPSIEKLEALFAWLGLDEDDRELLAVYQDNVNDSADIEEARERFTGKFDSEEDWARQFLDDCGTLGEIPENLRHYFDYEAYARDAQLGGEVTFVRHGGDVWVFYN